MRLHFLMFSVIEKNKFNKKYATIYTIRHYLNAVQCADSKNKTCK